MLVRCGWTVNCDFAAEGENKKNGKKRENNWGSALAGLVYKGAPPPRTTPPAALFAAPGDSVGHELWSRNKLLWRREAVVSESAQVREQPQMVIAETVQAYSTAVAAQSIRQHAHAGVFD